MKDIWLLRLRPKAGMLLAFDTEEVLNAYVDKYHPNWDENDYQVLTMAMQVIHHIDDV